ncbi:Pantothenate transporter FEN2 [Vanrija pseudolonga]|uniref:Pantothenate transporter FEN2 n=1 Tax=Vanrija pseudolonga TaxID=143232 RepID=A0AAF0Y807_9TREE|nr:Pantothenate transporter FEN2 [Vanrija pseudolonga]
MSDLKEKPRASASADGVDQVPVLTGGAEPPQQQRTWKSYVWSSLDVSKEEARFLTKLDITLISSAALGVMIRYLDHYVFGQIPSNLILTRVNASYYIAFLELGWTIATFCTAAIKNTNHLYAVRFIVGLFEAGHFPAVMYVCSSYYKPHELARRNTLIQICTQVGPLFSGFLMAAIYSGLNNRLGMAGWRWLFIICGVISFPCAVWTAIAMPKLPSRAKANWIFTQREVELARERMPSETKIYTGLFKWKDIYRWHKTWHVWLFPLFFIFACQFGQAGGSMIFWAKSYNVKGKPPVFTVQQINLIPLGMNVIGIMLGLLASWISDGLPGARRWPIMAFTSVMAIIFSISLAATPVHPPHKAQRWLLYYLTPLAGCSAGVTWTAVNETSRGDPEKRAYVSAAMNALAYIFIAWLPIFTFPTYKQPYVSTGLYITAGFGLCAVLVALAIAYFDERDRRRAASAKDAEARQVIDSDGESK